MLMRDAQDMVKQVGHTRLPGMPVTGVPHTGQLALAGLSGADGGRGGGPAATGARCGAGLLTRAGAAGGYADGGPGAGAPPRGARAGGGAGRAGATGSNDTGAAAPRWTVSLKRTSLTPKRITSPSRSGRGPLSGASLTKVPVREPASSTA